MSAAWGSVRSLSVGAGTDEVMTQRALNRATLARQRLLARVRSSALDTVAHLVGMQAQVPRDPYTGLWSRLEGFEPDAVASQIATRAAVRAPLMRATIHLVTAEDCRVLRSVLQPVLERAFRSGSPFGRRLPGVDLDELVQVGVRLVEEEPRTRAELRSLLGERWPDRDADAMAYAITYLVPLVQVTPRGLWDTSGRATWTTVGSWLGIEPERVPSRDDLVRRYLGAFGPASVQDAQVWCGLTGLKDDFERLRPSLRTFRAESGRELFDLADAPRPDPEVPAPPRFLPEYDNLTLSHADRSRFGTAHREQLRRDYVIGVGGVVVDGLLRGTWRVVRDDRAAALMIRSVGRWTKDERAAVLEEAGRLIRFHARGSEDLDVRIVRSV